MKKIVLMLMMAVAAISAHAQKYALVDMEYILRNIPAYERANEQLNQVSRKWQAEVEALNLEASTMYKNYQNEVVFLSQEQKKAKQDSIMQKEKEASDLKKKYFGAEGELYKKRAGTDGTYPGGDLQCREGDFQPARLLACSRQSQQHGIILARQK